MIGAAFACKAWCMHEIARNYLFEDGCNCGYLDWGRFRHPNYMAKKEVDRRIGRDAVLMMSSASNYGTSEVDNKPIDLEPTTFL